MSRLYKDIFDKITPTQEETERIRKNLMEASRETQSKGLIVRRRFTLGKVAVAVLAAVMVFGTTVFADEVKELFSGFLNREEKTADFVEENIFQASDEHVSVQVLELLSDEISVQMTVKYEALDETGKEWLDSVDKMDSEELCIQPDWQGNTVKYGTNLSYGCLELEDFRTDTERYFYVFCENSHWNTILSDGKFTYCIPDGSHTVALDISCNVPVYEYDLQAADGETLSDYYEPVSVRLSMLSYVVYGKSEGMFDNWVSEDGSYSSGWIVLSEEKFNQENVDQVTLLKSDGTEIQFGDEGYGLLDLTFSDMDDDEGYNCVVVSDIFTNVWEQIVWDKEADEVIDPEEIVGIRLENEQASVEYTFTE